MTSNALPPETRAALPMALLRAREAVMARFRPMLAAHGINEQQWRVIRVLAESAALDASEVAARAAILAPSLTRMIRSLTERGLITRAQDAGDRRRAMLALTPAGHALIGAVAPESIAIYRDIEEQAGTARVQDLLVQLNALTEALESVAPKSP